MLEATRETQLVSQNIVSQNIEQAPVNRTHGAEASSHLLLKWMPPCDLARPSSSVQRTAGNFAARQQVAIRGSAIPVR